MPASYSNFQTGTITDNPLTSGATTINSASLANLPAIASPNFMWLVLDPLGTAGAPEIVKVTAHTASATSATITRGQQGTSARAHNSGVIWTQSVISGDLAGLIQYDTEANKPTAPASGYRFYATDTSRDWLYDGSGWVIMSEPIVSFTPTITAQTGTFTSVSGSMRYTRNDGWFNFGETITVTTNGTAAGGVISDIPVSIDLSSAAYLTIGGGRENAITGKLLQLTAYGSGFIIFNYDGSYPAATGAVLNLFGRFRMSSRYS